jgi:hypothetical protein
VVSDITLAGAAGLFGPVVAAVYGRMWSRGLSRLKQLMESGALSPAIASGSEADRKPEV